MKIVRSLTGPFSEKPVFTQADIENVCESELMKADLYPAKPEPVRVERLIEKRFGISVEYSDLPEGVLGYTAFGESGVQAIVVSRVLGENVSVVARRRINTTLAHEAGHGFLHAYLYGLASKSDIFSIATDDTDGRPKILCRDGAAGWSEVQANMAMGSLLLPEGLVKDALVQFMDGQRLREGVEVKAAAILSETFDVNPVVARIRLSALFQRS